MVSTAIYLPVSMLLLISSFSAHSQQLGIPDTPEKVHLAPPPSDRFPAKWYPRVDDGRQVAFAPVEGHPFTALTGPIMPPTGKTSGQQSIGFQARDRFGRTRSENESGGYWTEEQMVKTKSVVVSDPVSHCDFHWTQPMTAVEMPPDMRVALVTCRPQTLLYKEDNILEAVLESVSEGVTHNGGTTTKAEHLAPIQMDSLTIKRLRVTNTTIDVHGQTKEWLTETWYSPELREVVRMGTEMGTEDDGYTGLSNIQLKDPDPNLFYPPDDFRIELQPAP